MPPVVKVLEQSLVIDFDPKGLEIHHSADWLLLEGNAELTVLPTEGSPEEPGLAEVDQAVVLTGLHLPGLGGQFCLENSLLDMALDCPSRLSLEESN